ILPLGDALVAREREMIEVALAETGGRVSGRSGAAARLGLPASTLEYKIRTLKIRKEQYRQHGSGARPAGEAPHNVPRIRGKLRAQITVKHRIFGSLGMACRLLSRSGEC